MKEIALTLGLVALVDDEDYEWLNGYKWCAHWSSSAQVFYAMRTAYFVIDGKRKQRTIIMHREILGLEYGDPPVINPKSFHFGDDRRTGAASQGASSFLLPGKYSRASIRQQRNATP